MIANRFEPIDADSLNKKAKVLSVRTRNSVLGFSRAAVTQHYIDVQDNEQRRARADQDDDSATGWAAYIAKLIPMLKK